MGNSYRLSLKNFNWPVATFIIGYHVALLVGLPIYFLNNRPAVGTVVTAVALLVLTEIGIGAAYHRFYSHRAYTLSKPAEAVLLFLGTLATQGSALRWSHDHRLHHAYVDSDRDPYSIKKGFWYAHVLWLFERTKPMNERWVGDLLENPLVRFQHRWAGTLSMLTNLAVALLVGWAFGDFLGAFVLVWWTRLLLSHHFTWFINSLAHTWGERTFSKEHTAVDNAVIALLTVGEGYHNYHHTFPADYRNGVRWYHFDPTKWTIWTLSKLGLAGNLRRYNDFKIRKRLITEDRKLLLGSLKDQARRGTEALETRVNELADRMQDKLNQLSAMAESLSTLKRSRASKATIRSQRRSLKQLRTSLREDWNAWIRLCSAVLARKPVAA